MTSDYLINYSPPNIFVKKSLLDILLGFCLISWGWTRKACQIGAGPLDHAGCENELRLGWGLFGSLQSEKGDKKDGEDGFANQVVLKS